ncbi:hypothetical protein COS31_04465 [Candidatus Roizmanbacteria bacterium CG02_land_8_20_14_3_00_36_15]|uniref:Uncharacterized protein n=1 Tax=Candidatus Roizmanbacteria bacterium CG_4_8_14_3_um_filter_36_10 TaxID=1974834 RepID=A0A2M8GNW7_9BACT|nr:MAG: hypothetical protein COS51_02240 [Candidatus Roizmanbacteria bacterium CG03_land_8_20_14_0_80_36_21]PIV37423.1 MAG: hypothetical protein COS31_04465 [Candidatus Roizmanbacteria bacterium CG02_land_8_20_14_3_00_36_15]PIY70498.1 MAG: hypothetical protein COY89_00515 [Candidatus Roizmanbacteria bacterium CG_4_10_14_0_8_um_filter_36_36]PJA53312.1 MAG: hypothetical protein CO166_02395 [Candidatus Roizmanbacteria bacterium CG_4_9_14_3_um_filter_36_11]PJC82240.1 MAG: hypothetical protein CO007
MQKSKLQFKIKKLIKFINILFINIILFLFYFLIIGFGALIYKLFKKTSFNKNSYWQDCPQQKPDPDYFKSPY